MQGVAWTTGIKWFVQVLTWAATVLVMRLLTPEDYGLVGMAALFLGLVTLVSEFGLGSAVVALRKLTSDQIAQLNTLAVLVGCIALVLSIAAAQPVANFFDSPGLPLVIVVLSSTFIISALNVVPAAVLRRDLRYRTLALVEAGQALGDVLATLLLAWLGFGYWSLVLGRLMKFVVGAVALWSISPQRFAVPHIRELRDVLTFSLHVITGRIGWYAYSNGDYLIVGKLLGQGALGVYNAAFTLSRMPAEKITGTVARVSPGIFSAVQEDMAALRRYILILTEGLSMATFAPIVGIGLVAEELVPVLLGDVWVDAVVPLQILSIGAALSAITPILPQVLQVIQETGFAMRRNVMAVVAFIPGFWLGGTIAGVAGVALAWVLLEPLFVSLPTLFKIRARTELTLASYGRALWPAVSACLAMAVVVTMLRAVVHGRLETSTLLAIEVAAGAIVYFLVVFAFHRERITRFRNAIRLLRK